MPSGPITVAVRLMMPFLRVYGSDLRTLQAAQAEGVDIMQLVQPDARLPHAQVMRVLERLVRELGDPELGLKAGGAVLLSDIDISGEAANSQLRLHAAAACISRYFRLLRGGAELSVAVDGPLAMWRYRLADQLEEPPAAHDFVVRSVSTFTRLLTGREEPKVAVHFAHGDRTNLEAYQRLFRCPIKFDMEHTGVVFPAERLSWPLAQPTAALSDVFEQRARDKLSQLEGEESVAALVRQNLLSSVESGESDMATMARRLGLSVPSLRRKLAAEGTSHSALRDEVRKQRALALLERRESATKISLTLGFSDSTAFHRAFRRWTGMTLHDYRRNAS